MKFSKGLAKKKGIKRDTRRPNPTDTAGLFFEEVQGYGEDISIIMAPVESFKGFKSFDQTQLYSVPHSHCDGISALKLLHEDNNKKIISYPKIKQRKLFRLELAFLYDYLLVSCKFFTRFPYRKFFWKNKSYDEGKLQSFSFSKDETRKILEKCKEQKISLNSKILYSVTQSCDPLLNKANWLIPLWAPSIKTTIEEASIYNHANFFELYPKQSDNLQQFDNYYQKILNSSSPFYWKMSFMWLNSFLKYPFKLLVWLANNGLKRSGAISNLGNFEGDLEGDIVFCPPVLSFCPVSFGILTYNGKLTISSQSKKSHGPGDKVLKEVLKKLKSDLLAT